MFITRGMLVTGVGLLVGLVAALGNRAAAHDRAVRREARSTR